MFACLAVWGASTCVCNTHAIHMQHARNIRTQYTHATRTYPTTYYDSSLIASTILLHCRIGNRAMWGAELLPALCMCVYVCVCGHFVCYVLTRPSVFSVHLLVTHNTQHTIYNIQHTTYKRSRVYRTKNLVVCTHMHIDTYTRSGNIGLQFIRTLHAH